VQNLEVIKVIPEENILLIKGSFAGAEDDYCIIREAKKRPKGWKPRSAAQPQAKAKVKVEVRKK